MHYVTIRFMKRDIEAFLEYLSRDKGYSRNTLAAYRNDLAQMAAFITSEQAKGIITSYDGLLKGYLLRLREKRYSVATTARKVASAKSFFKFMVDAGRMRENPAQNLPSPQVSRRALKFLSPAEYQKLLAEAAKLSTPEAKRDAVMLELLYATGVRISELVSLNTENIDLERNCVRIDSKRQVPFEHRLGLILGNFLRSDRLDLLYDESEQALFLNRRGRRLTRQGFWQIIKGYASRAGLGGKVTPQTLRHSFARRKLQNGVELNQLQRLLGHAYISSTRIYKQPAPRRG
ncbi:MAG: tyrosine-type recombinase/integrase [Dehalococcoidia bacterium]|nr:tyrosine-type recombinase/integrase [Dehalococcoidia bacterium]MDH4300116.1 tyrosine-type recombinase/integrase [Dehalococcoidia bacterium]MDH4367977.1 tyrosine-type recombinase/integrase [Dehalococcoidia bacterium]